MKKNDILVVLAILILAFTLRFIYLSKINNDFFFLNPVLDAKVYDDWAVEISQGDWIGRKVFFMNPGYPYFLAVLYKIFGHSLYFVAVIQFIIGSIGCILVYFIALRVFNKTAAIIAGIMACLYNVSFYYEGMLLSATLINFLNVLLVLVLLLKTEKPAKYLVSGVLLGLSALFRPNVLLFVLFLGVWAAMNFRRDYRLFVTSAGFFIFGLFIVFFPVTLRNYIVGGEFVLTTSSGGTNFYIGNNPSATGVNSPPSFARLSPDHLEQDFKEEAEKRLRKNLTSSEISRYWFNQSIEFIKKSPISYIKLMWRKFWLFWNFYEIGGNFDFYFDKKWLAIQKVPLLSFGIIAPLGIIGMILAVGNWKKTLLLYLYILTYLIAVVLFFILSEYRYPVVPLVIIFAGYTVYWWKEKIKAKDLKSLAFSVAGGLIAFLAVNRNICETRQDISYYNLGGIYLGKTRIDEAIEEYKKAIKINPEYFMAYNNLGLAYNKKGYYDKAILAFKKAVHIKPDFADAYVNLALSYGNKLMYDEAISATEKAIKIKPNSVVAYNNLGGFYYRKKLYNRAMRMYKEAIRIDPYYAEAYNNLGVVYISCGMREEAIKLFKKALTISPGYAGAENNYKRALRESKP
ncbi:MAG: tetratricopeptide repeat protein [Elusimicrobia bacterium]|nr:tetratricopeptide repeat protein [Elusimicrobiota bacterium]